VQYLLLFKLQKLIFLHGFAREMPMTSMIEVGLDKPAEGC
jgi:hypothetical protein